MSTSSAPLMLNQHQLQPGVLLSQLLNVCPRGTKLMALNLGSLECDTGWLMRGANTSVRSNPKGPENPQRRELSVYALLIDHPTEGLILMDTGCGRNFEQKWGHVADVFAPEQKGEEYELDTAIKNLGYDISQVKKVIMGHLHLDHAGGLTYFVGTDTEIWVNKIELESAFYSAATDADADVYQKYYLNLDLNWKCFTGQTFDFAPGLTLHHLPGHTYGLCGLQVNLPETGTLIFLNDHAHVQENYDGSPPGWLVRDYQAWYESNQRVKRLQKATNAQVFPGHDLAQISKIYGKILQ